MQLNGQAALVTGGASKLGAATARGLAASIPFPHRLGHADEFAAFALHMIDNPCLNGEVVRLDASLRMAPK
jgi:NAD(P)-dependent dehydrogenase (short-subunit alcohol dehydrogenase family)